MGLDMYLYRREYLGGGDIYWNGDIPNRKELYNQIISSYGITPADSCGIYIDLPVGYWRKANSIHKWFCSLDGGRDECQDIYVTLDKLLELKYLCEQVVLQPANGPDILPTQGGFFFGSLGYDDYYLEDMTRTIQMIDTIVAENKDKDWTTFIYRASW